MSLLVAIAFCSKDADRALDLLEWCVQLGRQNHPCLLCMDPDVDWETGSKAVDLAGKAFATVRCAVLPNHVEGWIPGSNALWKLAASEARAANSAFLFVEPDAVPLKPDWVDRIESAYRRCGKSFLGPLVSHQQTGLPSPYMEGVAVYPANALQILGNLINNDRSWTLSTAPVVVPQAENSVLFKHVWGEKDRPPTFAETNVPGSNVFCLRNIPDDAVIWHRCKDGSLIRQLRKAKGLLPTPPEIITLFAFCAKDAVCMAKSLRLMGEMDGRMKRTCVLHHDGSAGNHLSTIHHAATGAFETVRESKYPTPPVGNRNWPAAPNWAFRHACSFMQRFGKPWLWFEGDAVPMRRGWLYSVEERYDACGHAFLGPMIDHSHINGTPTVYPADAMNRFSHILNHSRDAFDMAIKNLVMADCENAEPFLSHDRTVRHFLTVDEARNVIDPRCLVYHPCKNSLLPDRVRELNR